MGRIRDQLRAATERAQTPPPRARPTVTRARPEFKVNEQRKRPPSEEVEDWIAIASRREPPRSRDRETLRNYLKAKNPRRWALLQRQLRWAENQMLKLGMNPEDTRWIL